MTRSKHSATKWPRPRAARLLWTSVAELLVPEAAVQLHGGKGSARRRARVLPPPLTCANAGGSVRVMTSLSPETQVTAMALRRHHAAMGHPEGSSGLRGNSPTSRAYRLGLRLFKLLPEFR